MISVSSYYEYLYQNFLRSREEEFQKCISHDHALIIPPPTGTKYEHLVYLLTQIEQKYGFNMRLNYRQLYLWQKNFCPSIDIEAILAAGNLVLFCCLVDNILDSKRFSPKDKEIICNIINLEKNSIQIHRELTSFAELSDLINGVFEFYRERNNDTVYSVQSFQQDIRRAVQSEIYMYHSSLLSREAISREKLVLMTDKSIAFEKASFLTASFGHNTDESIDAAITLGNCFWLLDDLCDFIEDIRARRKNSLLLYCVDETDILSLPNRVKIAFENIDKAIYKLNKELYNLKLQVDIDLYSFIMSQVWKWSSHVRRIAQQIDKC